jgi:aryl-alcohol dehydrogenase-like predicted oxidoreductase
VLGTDWLGSRRHVQVAGRRVRLPFVDKKRNRDNFELLDGVREIGCTAFDTARAYDDSERSLGAWIRSRRIRERVVLISKGGHPGPEWQSRLASGEISRDLELSLKALQTEYIDVYLVHYDDEQSEVAPIVDVLNRHLLSGKVRCIGVSNWPPRRIADANTYARLTHQAPVAVSSVQFSLASWRYPPWKNARSISGDRFDADRQWYREHGLWILAYSSLAMGFFSSSRPYAGGDRRVPTPGRLGDAVFLDEENLGRLNRARALARQLGVSPGQVALSWVLHYDVKVLALVGSRSVAAYRDAAGACSVELSEAQRAWLDHGP